MANVSQFTMKGMCCAPCSPFEENGDLAVDRIEKYVDHMVEYKISSLFGTGTLGEANSMTVEERKQIMKAYVDYAQNKKKLTGGVMLHIGAGNLRDSQELARYAEKIGAEAIACVSPTYYKPLKVEDYVDYMAEVAKCAPNTPFHLYDFNQVTGVMLDLNDFFTLASKKIPTLRGVKHTSTEFYSMNNCYVHSGGKYQVTLGSEEHYLSALALGLNVPVVNTFTAPTLLRVKAAFDKGDMETARKEQTKTVQLHNIRRKCGYHIVPFSKAILKLIGVDLGPPRLPLKPLTDEQVNALKKDLTDIGFFEWCRP